MAGCIEKVTTGIAYVTVGVPVEFLEDDEDWYEAVDFALPSGCQVEEYIEFQKDEK